MKNRTKAWAMNSLNSIVNGYTVTKAIETSSDLGAREFAYAKAAGLVVLPAIRPQRDR